MRIVAKLMVVVLLAGCMASGEKSEVCLAFAMPEGYGEPPWKPLESSPVESAGFATFANGDVEYPTEKVIAGCHMNARGGLLGWLDAKAGKRQ